MEEEKNVEALQQALELFNASAERLRATHDSLRSRVQELTIEAQDLRNRLENVLASITDGVVVLDRSLTVTMVNAAAAMLGFSEGVSFTAAFGETAGELLPCIEGALGGDATAAHEVEVALAGEKRFLSFSAAPLHGGAERESSLLDTEPSVLGTEPSVLGPGVPANGHGGMRTFSTPTSVVISFRDVTELRRLRADLNRKERLAVLGEMAAAIAHEVRNPLGGLRLFAGLVRNALERDDAGSALEHLTSITNSIGEIDVTIENVLTFARDMELRFATIPLATVVEEAVAELNGLFEETGISFKNRIPENLMVHVDGRLLRSALANLMDNAVKVQEPGGVVELWHEVAGDGEDALLRITVGDRGPGVTEKEAGEWFAPFRTGRAEGTGLGLAIVERIAEAHGGRAELRPREGGGAEAVIILPANLVIEEVE